MPFKKNDTRINRKGRPKGSKNIISYDLRENINYFLNDKFDEVISEFNKLKPSDKVKFYLDFMQYSISRLKSIELINTELNLDEEKADLSLLTVEELKKMEELYKKALNN